MKTRDDVGEYVAASVSAVRARSILVICTFASKNSVAKLIPIYVFLTPTSSFFYTSRLLPPPSIPPLLSPIFIPSSPFE